MAECQPLGRPAASAGAAAARLTPAAKTVAATAAPILRAIPIAFSLCLMEIPVSYRKNVGVEQSTAIAEALVLLDHQPLRGLATRLGQRHRTAPEDVAGADRGAGERDRRTGHDPAEVAGHVIVTDLDGDLDGPECQPVRGPGVSAAIDRDPHGARIRAEHHRGRPV